MQQITEWLEKLGMSEYAQRFAENRVDFSVLPDLTDQDLKDLGVVLGDRRKILRAIAKLDATAEAVTLMPKPMSTVSVATEQQSEPIAEESSERHHVTLMFCDVVDPADVAAKLDAEEWRDPIDACLDAASAAVTEMGGSVAKTLADGLMALFGYPAAQENDSERAVRAALATQRALTELNRVNADTSKPALAARIAIDSGPVVIDADGEIFGDVPNIVTQAQALAEPGAIVVTARVKRQIADLFVVKERGSYQLERIPDAVTLYRIVRATGGGHPRPNYHRLITHAVKGLDRSTAEARQAVYERARKAMVAQLRFNQPAVSKADITKERLALEEAIRKVEAEAARKSPTDIPTEPRSATPPSGVPDSGAQAASGPPRRNRANPPPADIWAGWPAGESPAPREQLLRGQSSLKKQAVKGFRNVHDLGAGTANAAKTVRQTGGAYEEEGPQHLAEEPASWQKFEPHLDSQDVNSVDSDTWQERDLEPAYELEEERPIAIQSVRSIPRSMVPADEYERTRPPLSYGSWARLLVVLIILGGVAATISWQWSAISELYQFLTTRTKPQTHDNHKTPSTQSKSFRAPQGQGTG